MPISPIKVGVTGGIGSGKTLVCDIFSALGIPIYNADQRAKSLMTTNENVVKEIKHHFGDEAYTDTGELNRSFLANNVFSDPEKLAIINGIVHPAVAVDFAKWVENNSSAPYVIKEAALLVEAGSYKELDKLIVVTAKEDIRINRVLFRDQNRDEKQIREIISRQLPEDEKVKKATFIIKNDGDQLLLPQVLNIHEVLNSSPSTG